MPRQPSNKNALTLEVLQQFRVIYGSMRQYFREVEERCGLPGSQMWLLQEVQKTPYVGVTELAGRLGVHQSTCSQLVDRLVALSYLTKSRPHDDQRRIGLCLTDQGQAAIAALPGPAEGILPEALSSIPEVALRTLHINLSELIKHLPGNNVAFARMPLAEIVDTPSRNLL